MTQYLLSVWHGPISQEEFDAQADDGTFEAVGKLNAELMEKGQWVFGGGLEGVHAATVVRSDANGDVAVTDGPYAEIKENMGGFWVVELNSLDEALELAKRATVACHQPVEVRPFQSEPEA